MLLDETNDISMLGVTVIYCSNNCGKVVSSNFCLIQMEKCDVESIYTALRAFLAHNTFDVKNLVVFCTDTASAMAEINNGVYIKSKNCIPSLILTKNTCHTLQLPDVAFVSVAGRQNLLCCIS